MMDEATIVSAICSSTQVVFSTMLGLEAMASEAYTETNSPGPSDGIIAVIGLAGAWVGTASVCCNAAMGRRIASQMLGMEFTEVNEEALDAISEITNMIIGNFKTHAESYFGPLGLSIPTVIYGLQFSARTAAKEQWVVVPFECEEQTVEVKVCLTPNRGLPRVLAMSSTQLVHH
jgi:chemotaxis protein CheX